MAEVTVCIPAYRAERFIGHTLASVQSQTFADFEVVIAIEPEQAEETLAACAPFLEDPRFRASVNPEVLGYAGNVRALFRRVATPLFVPLPHDDAWHPRALERMHGLLAGRPDAVAAYPDLLCFAPDGIGAGVVRYEAYHGGLADRLTTWFLDGATGNIWHGMMRSDVLGTDYPDNRYDGFAVECEWALHVLSEGPVQHLDEPLYLKRQPSAVNPSSVSGSWVRSESMLPPALEHHRQRLLDAIPEQLAPAEREIVTLAAEAAMLRRHQEFADGRWGLSADQQAIAGTLLKAAEHMPPDVGTRLSATVRWALSRHAFAQGDLPTSEEQARQGLAAQPDDVALCVQLGWLLIARDAVLDAAEIGIQASRVHPEDPHLRMLLRQVDDDLVRQMAEATGPAAVGDSPAASTVDAVGEGLSDGVGLPQRIRTQAAIIRAKERELDEARARTDEVRAQADALEVARDDLFAECHRIEAERAALARDLRRTRRRMTAIAQQGRTAQLRRAIARRSGVLMRLGGPPPHFNAAWYRKSYRGVPKGRLAAWRHWSRVGWRAGHDPNPLFDTSWYLDTYPDVRALGMDPLTHYVLHGTAEGRAPGPEFDPAAYLERYADVRASGVDPLLHYLLYGVVEGRIATPLTEPE